MSRRIPSILSAVFSIAIGAGAACSLGTTPPAIPSAYHPTAPRQAGGTVVLTDYEEPRVLHPVAAGTDAELRAGALLFAPLWGVGPGLQPYPDLAARVPTSENGAVQTHNDGR